MKLKPCPFCGTIFGADGQFATNQGGKWGFMFCTNCAAAGPEVRTNYGDDWHDDAIDAWNKRELDGESQE